MDRVTEQEVRRRAGSRCEYCRLPESFSKLKFVVDHIIARQHGGTDDLNNLALACGFCNRHKGPNVAGIDPETKALTRLYHPRQDRWEDHFAGQGATIVGNECVWQSNDSCAGDESFVSNRRSPGIAE